MIDNSIRRFLGARITHKMGDIQLRIGDKVDKNGYVSLYWGDADGAYPNEQRGKLEIVAQQYGQNSSSFTVIFSKNTLLKEYFYGQ